MKSDNVKRKICSSDHVTLPASLRTSDPSQNRVPPWSSTEQRLIKGPFVQLALILPILGKDPSSDKSCLSLLGKPIAKTIRLRRTVPTTP